MTYCAGWKYKDSVYLLADTAATKPTAPSTTFSSFRQLHAEVRGEHVEECLLKLVPIGQGTVIAYAGDVQLATQILDFLKENLRHAMSNTELLSLVMTSMGPFDIHRTVGLLVASSSTDGSTELLRWSTKEGLDTSASDYYQVGSLTSYHTALTPTVLSRLVAGNLAPDRVLPVITAIVQSYGVYDNLIDMNVGGLIFGVRTERGTVTWQEDTNYVLYDRAFANNAYISALARDNALIVHSSSTNDIRLFAHSTSMPSPSQWDDTWRRKIKSELDSDRFRYWVFISTAERLITLIIRNDLERESRFVRLTSMGEGKFDMAFSPELISLLLQPMHDRRDGSIPFRLNVRND